MLLTAVIIVALWSFKIGPRLIVEFIATVFGIILYARAGRATQVILASRNGPAAKRLDFDCRPSRAERRALAKSLRTAINLTDLGSLFPAVAARTRQIANV